MSILATKRRRDFARQRWQFLAVLITITLGVMMFAASYDAYRNLEASYTGTHQRLAFADATVTGANPQLAETIGAIDGVATVETRTRIDLPMRVGNDVIIGRLLSMPADTQPAINRIDVTDGSSVNGDRPDGVVLETHMAEGFDLSIGDTIDVLTGTSWIPVEVVGIGVSPEYLWPARSGQDLFPLPKTFGVVYASDVAVDRLEPGAVPNQVLVQYEANVDRENVDAAVQAAADSSGAEFVAQADQPSNAALSLDLQGFQQLSIAFPALFLLAAGMAALILLNRLVYSQRSQIGTLRASGMSNRTLSGHYLSYGLILGVVGAVAGVLLGMAAGWAITASYTAELGIPDTIRELRWITPVIGLLFGIGTGAIAALAPARAAFGLSPAEAMRGDVPTAAARASLLERVIPPLRGLPTRWLMVLRGVGRNWRRSLSTVIGVVLALTLILTSWGMIDTVDQLLSRQFGEVDLADATAVFGVAVGSDQVDAIAAVDGVAVAEPVITLPATISFGGASYSTQLHGYLTDTAMHGFTNDTRTLPDDGVLGGAALADELGVAPGDTVTVSITGKTSIDTTFAGFVDEPLGTMLYMHRGALVDAIGEDAVADPTVTTVASRFDDGSDPEAVIDTIGRVDGVVSVVDDRALASLIGDFMGFFYLFVGLMLALGAAIAFALIFNTISVNVAERSTEYATMRANGLSSRSVAALITGENVLLTTIGIVPGLIVGYLAADWFMHSYTSDLLQFDLEMRPSTLVLAALAMIVVALLSVIPGIRTVNRLDLAEVVRERAA